VVIVTARQEIYREVTEQWLLRNGMPYDQLIMTGTHKKEEACLEQRLQIMVEDTLEVGIDLCAVGIHVLLLDAPYNRRDLPEMITRVFNWQEIYEELHGRISIPG